VIYLLAEALERLGGEWEVFRILGYTSVRGIGATMTTLLLMLIFAPMVIRHLYLAGQRDEQREFDPQLGKSKRGTPTMGGVMIIGSVLISIFLWGNPANVYLWATISAMVIFGILGAVDDLAKVKGKSADAGLSRGSKLLIQTLFGLALGCFLFLPATTPFPVEIRDTIGIPFLKPASYGGYDVHLAWGYIIFVTFVVVAVSNAVNLIDGLDGLAASTTIPPIMVYGVLAFILGDLRFNAYLLYPSLPGAHELIIFVAALVGALVGFLWFNGYPAEVFMGDTGSLSLGGVLAVLVILTKQELLFVIAGGLFIFVNATHIIGDQIGLRMLGRRIFYRTPIHHSFEHLGLSETKVVMRFFIVAMVLALFALATLKLR